MNLMKYKPLLFNPRFLLLWIGSFISGIGDAVAVVVIIWTLYNQTFSPLFITLALICLELPSILLGPLWGVYVDRSPRTLVVLANIIRGCLFLYLLIVPLDSIANFSLFLGLLCISSSLAPITKAGENMVVPKTVDKANLVTANSLMYIQFDLALVVGPLIGGILASQEYIQIAFIFNAITFFISAIFFMYVFPKKQLVKGIEKQKQKLSQKFSSWNTEFREGLSYSFQNKSIASLMIISFLWNLLIWGTSPTLLPIFNKNQLMEGATGYGMLGAATSFGIVIGSLVIGALKVKHSLYELVMFSIILHGIVYAFLFIVSDLWVAVMLFSLSGIISAPAMIYMRTIVQQHVPEEKLGRIFTVLSSFGAFGFPLGTTLASTFVMNFGEPLVSVAFLIFGGILSLTVIILSIITRSNKKGMSNVQNF
ncbi:MFS transporter [Bacillus cereus]|nr:MFS transporter [Bacillus cereus]MCU5545149.1 MFS transporter [Bacillus cereus]HDR8141937.1 MFS transporter [Bacillus cereus]